MFLTVCSSAPATNVRVAESPATTRRSPASHRCTLAPRRVDLLPNLQLRLLVATALALPQNCVLYKGLQGLTFDEIPVQNEMMGHCRLEQLIDRRGAKNPSVERHDTGRAGPQESGPGRLHHRTRRRLPHRQAHGGHHRERGRVLQRESGAGSCQRYAGGCLSRLLGLQQGALRLPQAHGAGRGQEAALPRTRRGDLRRRGAHLRHGRGGQGNPGHHPHPQRRGHRQPHRQALVQERRPHHPEKRGVHGESGLGYRRQGQS